MRRTAPIHKPTTLPGVCAWGVTAAVGGRSSPIDRATLQDQPKLGRLAYSQMKDQAISNTAPAHRIYETSFTVFTFWAACLLPDARSSALK